MPPKEENKKEFDGIRVVDDPEPEEVVRLESPKIDPSARKEPSKEQMALPTMMGDADEDEVPMAISPENEWLVAAEAKEVTSVPMGWFILLFVVLGGVVLWAFWQGGEVEETVDVKNLPGSAVDKDAYEIVARSISSDKEAIAREEAAKDYAQMENVLRGFFSAKTVEERLAYVRHQERVRPLMEDHYSKKEFRSMEYQEAREYHVISLGSWPFVALSAQVARGETYPILLENTDKGYLVDWESFEAYQPMSLKELVEKRPTEGIDLRVYGTYDNFYAYEFTEDQDYRCVKLTSKEGEQVVFGYVLEGTKVASEMKKYLTAPPGKKKTQPFILKVRFLPESKAPRSVLIEKIISSIWAYPTNPDEK